MTYLKPRSKLPRTTEFDELAEELGQGRYPDDARSRMIEVLRKLEKGRDPYAVSRIPMILERMPYLTWDGVRYVSAMREGESEASESVLLELLQPERFHRDQEWLYLARAGLLLRKTPSLALASRFGHVAMNHGHPLVRARALLAWGRLSDPGDFEAADRFWPSADPAWQGYVLVPIQQKEANERDERYLRWSAEGRFLRTVAESIQTRRFQWKVV